MALKIDYVIRETASNIVRNVTLSIASVLTVFVSLSLVGTSLLLRDAVDNATARWQGGIEFIIFFQPDAPQDQIDAVGRDLDDSPQVTEAVFVNQEETFEEFKDLFRDQPQIVQSVTPDILPPSYRVVPVDKDAAVIEGLTANYESRPGVREVVAAFESIRTIQRISGTVGWAILVVSFFLLVASLLLILNSIRMAMFARRREIEVMKLVGASNWFIRVPFMLEGLVQSLIGSFLSLGVLFGVRTVFSNFAADPSNQLFAGFNVDASQVTGISLLLVGGGAFIGAIGSAVAVSRFLDV